MTGYIPPLHGNPPISQNYGDNPGGTNPPNGHNGRDYAVPIGTPIVAVTDGTILYEGWTTGNYQDNPWWFLPGDMVIVLATDNGTQFVYGHLNTTSVTAGDRVTQNQIIGTTGNTGKSTGPHLHFEALTPGYNLNNGMYGRTDPGPYIDTPTITTQSTAPNQEDFMAGQIDAEQAEAIAQRAANLVITALNGKLTINPQQAEDIVQATTARTATAVKNGQDGATINTQQADDIAQAAARYNQTADANLYTH